MKPSPKAAFLLAMEPALIEAGERAARLAVERAHALGLKIPYAQDGWLVELWPDGTVHQVKPLDPVPPAE
jgi:hypothetical protein